MTTADAPQRIAALDPTRSFAVTAPAGSGKTELLTQRVLRLLSLVEEPEQILCMTFTRKAAGEMHHRIIDALRRASAGEQPQTDHQQITHNLATEALHHSQKCNWQLLENPNRLRIQTIDGFCLSLAQQLAVESGFGEYAEPLDDPIPVYRDAIAELLLPTLEKPGALSDAISSLLRHLDNDLNKLETLLINLLSKREQWLGHLFQSRDERLHLEGFLNNIIEETLSEAHQLLSDYGSDLALLADYAASQLPNDKQHSPISACLGIKELPDIPIGYGQKQDSDQSSEQNPKNLHQWLGICELLLTGKHEWRKQFNKNNGFPTEAFVTDNATGDKYLAKAQKAAMGELVNQLKAIPGLRDCLEDIRFLPPAKYQDNQWAVLNALTILLPALVAQLSLAFQQQKVCDFTEITLAALRALGLEDAPTDLGLKMDYQIQHILTDEFQDTSSVQFAILRRLTAGWQPDDGHSLFIVGDAMQSLYGFRSANVGLFLEARSMPIGNIQLEPLELCVNFRSQAGIIDWVNQAFNDVFPDRENISRGAVSYSAALAHHPELAIDAVTADAFIHNKDHHSKDQYGEALQVEKLVTEAKQADPQGSIAILVRNRTHLPEILNVLQEAGHSWQASDIDPLGRRMAVIDLMSLTRAMLSPADRIAWLSILRAPWCGLDLKDLFTIANTELPDINPTARRQRYPLLLLNILNYREIAAHTDLALSADAQQILARVADTLKQGWDQRYRKPLRGWIEGLWIALGGRDALRSTDELQQCQQYLDLLERHEDNGAISDWPAFEKAVQSLYAKPDTKADPNLHVMTIHKAKGLEFDTVIIPALNRKPRGDDKQLMLWNERINHQGENQLIIGPLEQTGQDDDPIFRYLQREQKLKNTLEKDRVLYVGVTRAIKRLHFLYSIEEGKKPIANSLLENLWPVLQPTHGNPSSITRYHYPSVTEDNPVAPIAVLDTIYRLPTDWQPSLDTIGSEAQRSETGTSGVFDGFDQEQRGNSVTLDSGTKPSTTAQHTGTVLHRTLRQLVIEGVENWTVETIQQRAPFWHIQLRQLGVSDTATPLATIQRAITTCLGNETAAWLLDNQHTDSQCEFALGYCSNNGAMKTAVVDRTFIDNKTRWIIDYKTSEPTEGETLSDFVTQQVSQYRGQLEHYAALYAQIEPLPVKTALYFPLIGHLQII